MSRASIGWVDYSSGGGVKYVGSWKVGRIWRGRRVSDVGTGLDGCLVRAQRLLLELATLLLNRDRLIRERVPGGWARGDSGLVLFVADATAKKARRPTASAITDAAMMSGQGLRWTFIRDSFLTQSIESGWYE
jgi:hypothetical protein